MAAGLLAAFVGFASSFAVVLQGLRAVGASPAEAASGLMALAIAMGVGGIWLSARSRMPISVAWSTPGAALLAGSALPAGGFAGAVGAFLVSGVLIVAAGLFRPLGRAVAAIPPALANAMLAGVLLPLCLAPVRAVAAFPALALPMILGWAVMARVSRIWAIPVAVGIAAILTGLTARLPAGGLGPLAPEPVLVVPVFDPAALIGLALPLFLVTMASQNIPGLAVLAANHYRPAPGPLFWRTGILSLLAAPFGGHAVNLAAITAALCANPDAHADPARRYWAAMISGAAYILFGLAAGAVVALVSVAPPVLIQAVAGLALLGSLGGAIMGAMADPDERDAAVITFVVAASGIAFLGIGSAFWGLLCGLGLRGLANWRQAMR
jgi:benzoate membrane transport protein